MGGLASWVFGGGGGSGKGGYPRVFGAQGLGILKLMNLDSRFVRQKRDRGR